MNVPAVGMPVYAVLLPSPGTGIFTAWGIETAGTEGDWRRLDVILSWRAKMLPSAGWPIHLDQDLGPGQPFTLQFLPESTICLRTNNREAAEAMFATANALLQLWLREALQRAGISDDQQAVIYDHKPSEPSEVH